MARLQKQIVSISVEYHYKVINEQFDCMRSSLTYVTCHEKIGLSDIINSVDPDQPLRYWAAADLDLHCFALSREINFV